MFGLSAVMNWIIDFFSLRAQKPLLDEFPEIVDFIGFGKSA
jgi:hypothetical protein